jgi:hypothetical protein
MKQLFYLICIIGLPLIVFFQYDKYRRHHPESVYAYPVSEEIDTDYHNPDKVLRYYQLTEEIGAYGRYCWKEEQVDVLRSDTSDPEAGPMTRRYQELIASARFLENKLEQSARWKQAGYNNEQIAQMELGLGFQSEEEQAMDKVLNNQVLARLNDQGSLVYEVQKKLEERGMDLRVDGIFRFETQQKVRAFQEAENLFPSGAIDLATMRRLWNVDK